MFSGIPSHDSRAAYEILRRSCEKVAELTGEPLVSLCETWHRSLPQELRFEPGDLQWLDNWASGLVPPHGDERRWMVASLFLLRASEKNRRNGVPGAIWRLSTEGYSPAASHALFLPNLNNPRPEFGDAIRNSVRRLGLRNGFDFEQAQIYYRTITLQFGLYSSCYDAMPSLLGGQNPDGVGSEIVRMLRRGAQSSRSFNGMMRALASFRSGGIQRDEVRRGLNGNPWIIPGELDRLLELSLRHSEIPVALDDGVAQFNLSDFAEGPFVRLSGGSAQFVLVPNPEISSELSDALGLVDPTVMMFGVEGEISRFLRQRDGAYHPCSNAEFRVPVRGQEVAIRLQNRSGSLLHAGMFPAFLPDDEFDELAWFIPSGAGERWRPALNYTPGKKNLLLAPSNWVVSNAESLGVAECGGVFWRLDGQAGALVHDEHGEVVWESTTGKVLDFPPARLVNLAVLNPSGPGYAGLLGLGDRFRYKLEGTDGVASIKAADWGPPTEEVANPTDEILLQPFHLAERMAVKFTLRGRVGAAVRQRTIRFRPVHGPKLLPQGALKIESSWVPIDPSVSANIREVGGRECLLAVGEHPGFANGREPITIMEGSRALPRKWYSSKGHITGLLGLGEPVKAVQGDHELTIFQSCHDGGIEGSAEIKDGENLQDHLMHQVEVAHGHRLVTWSATEGVRFWDIDMAGGTTVTAQTMVTAQVGDSPVECAGISYNGHCLGWASANGVEEMMGSLATVLETGPESSASQAAAAARWFGWPMLVNAPGLGARLSSGAVRHGLGFHGAWLGDQGLLPQMQPREESTRDRAWRVTRMVAGSWRPANLDETVHLYSLVLQDDISQIAKPSDQWALDLLLWNPALAARVIDLLMPGLASREARGPWIGPCLLRLEAIGQSGKRDTDDLIGRLRTWRDTVPSRTMATFIP